MKIISQNKNKTKKIGINIPFDGASVFNSTSSQREQIKANLTNFILTEKGERPYNQSFGTSLRKRLFEPMIDNDNFKEELLTDISTYFIGQINILNLDIENDYDNSLEALYLEYNVIYESESDTIILTFK
jgi:phage baseplate assembly protein W